VWLEVWKLCKIWMLDVSIVILEKVATFKQAVPVMWMLISHKAL